MSISQYLSENHSTRRIGSITLDDGKELFFRSMNEAERSYYDYKNHQETDKERQFKRARSRLIQMCLLDDEGKRREYGDDDEALESILTLDSKVTSRLADAISDHCGLSRTVDDAKKNSRNGHAGNSPTN